VKFFKGTNGTYKNDKSIFKKNYILSRITNEKPKNINEKSISNRNLIEIPIAKD